MKRGLFAILLLLSFMTGAGRILAQDDELSRLGFEEAQFKEEAAPYFGLGGGLTGTIYFLNFDDLNKYIKDANFGFGSQEFKSPIFLLGGEVTTVTIFIPNLRASFFWYGTQKTLTADTMIAQQKYSKNLEYALNFAGFSLNYTWVPLRTFAINPGISFGWSNNIIENYQGSDASLKWTDYKFGADQNHFLNRAETNSLFIQPHVNFEIALTNFFVFRAGVGYSLPVWNGEWTLNRDTKLTDVPDGINKNSGLNLQLGLFIGLFNY